MQYKLRNILMLGITVGGLVIASVVGCYAASVTYIYDEQNRLIRVEYPDGTITDYYYDELGNMRNKEPLDTTPPVTSASPEEDTTTARKR